MPTIDYSKFDKIVDSDDEEQAIPKPQPAKLPASTTQQSVASGSGSPQKRTEEGKSRLVGVLSSRIGGEQRLQRLKYLFTSIEEQLDHLDAMFVVWSAADELVEKVEAVIQQFQSSLAGQCQVKALRQSKRTSQFYDIRWLWDELLVHEQSGTWVLFTDDDDLWAPRRVQTYRRALSQHGKEAGVTGLCAAHKVRPTDRSCVATSASEVDQHLKRGDAQHRGGVHLEEEFFDFACPLSSLGEFLKMCNEETLLHPFCDLRFSRFLQEYYEGGKVMYIPTNSAESWVYYYSTAFRNPTDEGAYNQFTAQDQASTVLKIRQEDKTEAMDLLKQAHGARKPAQEEIDEMVDFVATLRQNTEAMLIRHFPEEPMKVAAMRRMAVEQAQGQVWAMRLAEKLARESCQRFGLQLVP
mmetsp:Transcript_73669/g.137674  ORF Transcript_73669/g.137674 Transcript_73669/m.137674 type:complete len:410 (+) Transcript_73669:91-1320(+)